MAYIATVRNQNHIIELKQQDHQAHVCLDGDTWTLDWHKLAPLASEDPHQHEGGRYSILIAGRSYDILVRRIPAPGSSTRALYEIWLEGQRFEVAIEDERTQRLTSIAQSGTAATASITAPMPGLVANLLVEPGENVAQDQPVVILEAMKMENDLPAPIAGTVREIRVNKGQTVDQGDVLVVIDGTAS